MQFWISSSSFNKGDEVENGAQSSPLVMKEETKSAKEIMLQKPLEKQQAKKIAKEVTTKAALTGASNPLETVDISGLSKPYVENMQNNEVHVIFSTDCNAFQVAFEKRVLSAFYSMKFMYASYSKL